MLCAKNKSGLRPTLVLTKSERILTYRQMTSLTPNCPSLQRPSNMEKRAVSGPIGQAKAFRLGFVFLKEVGALSETAELADLVKSMKSSPDDELPVCLKSLTKPCVMKALGESLGSSCASVCILWASLIALYKQEKHSSVSKDLMCALLSAITSSVDRIVHEGEDNGGPGISVGALCCLYPFIIAGKAH